MNNNHKKLGFDILKGQKIMTFSPWEKGDNSFNFTTDKFQYDLWIEDDGPRNDSHAYLDYISNLETIFNEEIIDVTEDSDSWGADITLKTQNNSCFIKITHNHNGYYGFGYELYQQELHQQELGVNMESNYNKYYNSEGKVAVLYSPGFGAGWSTWNEKYKEEFIFDSEIVELVLNNQNDKIQQLVENKYPDCYCGSAVETLKIAWLEPKTQFVINDYDGHESVYIYGISEYFTA